MMKLKYGLIFILFAFSLSSAHALFLTSSERERRNSEFSVVSDQILAMASGPDIIGNGAGLAEQNLTYLFRHLDRYLALGLNQSHVLDQQQRKVVQEILDVVLKNRFKKKSLVFLNSENFENFFNSHLDPEERVAKTGFSSDFPIFINLGQIYKNDLESEVATLLGILVHELGHQVGVGDHQYLDELAADIRDLFEGYYSKVSVRQNDNEFAFFHYQEHGDSAFDRGVLSIGQNNFIPFSVNDSNYTCPIDGKLHSMSWENAHFSDIREVGDELVVKISVWADIACSSPLLRSVTSLREKLSFEFKFKSLEQQDSFKFLGMDILRELL